MSIGPDRIKFQFELWHNRNSTAFVFAIRPRSRYYQVLFAFLVGTDPFFWFFQFGAKIFWPARPFYALRERIYNWLYHRKQDNQ